jgi:uncharacterized protein
MKVLITGATGLVGTELVSLLLKNGIYIHYLTTSEDKIQNEEKYKGYLWNPHTGEIDDSCIDGVDAVIHLAGASISKRWTESYKEEILDSRIVSTQILQRLLKNKPNKVQQFISASAIGIYPGSAEAVYNEESTDRDNSFLGHVVQKWEEAVDQVARTESIKVAKIRTGLVLSGKGGILKELSGPVSFGVGSAFGSGRQMQSWVHIRDLVGIYHFVLIHGLEGVFNAVAPYPVNQNALIKTVAKVMDKPYFMPNIPKFVMQAALGEMHALLFASQNVSARKIIGEGYQFKFLSLEKAIKNALHS